MIFIVTPSPSPPHLTTSPRSPPLRQQQNAMPVGTVPDISLAEVDFLYAALAARIRTDGRTLDQYQQADIRFGADWGNVQVTLGETR